MIRWLVVDLGGVTARYDPARRLRELARLTNLDPASIHHRLFTSGFDERTELGEASTTGRILDDIRDALDTRTDDSSLVSAWSSAFEPNRALLDVVANVSARRCLFTNNGPMINHCLAGRLGQIGDVFDEVICSWQLRAVKPDPAAFDRAQSRLDATAGELLLIDDSAPNVAAARHAGWFAENYTGITSFRRALATYDLQPYDVDEEYDADGN